MGKQKAHTIKTILKVLGGFLILLILLGGAFRLSLKTDWGRGIAKSKIISIANQSLNATVSVEHVDGDLWDDFTIRGLTVVRTDTLLALDELHIKYNVWSLLKLDLEIELVALTDLKVTAAESETQGFGLQELIRTDSTQTSSDRGSAFDIIIQQLELDNGSVKVYSPSYLPDSTLELEKITLRSSFSFNETISTTLSSLSFELKEGRLPEPIKLSTSGSYQDQKVTLGRLLIDTGNSMLEASGSTNLRDSTYNLDARTSPLSFRDIQPYLQQPLPSEKLQLTLTADGSFSSFQLNIQGAGNGLNEFEFTTDITLTEQPSVTYASLTGRSLDLGYFTNNEIDVRIGSFSADITGQLSQALESSKLDWKFELNQIAYEDRLFQSLTGNGVLHQNEFEGQIQLQDLRNKITLDPVISSVFSENPEWELLADISLDNIRRWFPGYNLDGPLHLNLKAGGQGFDPATQSWAFDIQQLPAAGLESFTIADQRITNSSLSGTVSSSNLNTKGFIEVSNNKVQFAANLSQFLSDAPTYSYELHTKKFNANELSGINDFQTSLNIYASGTGRYFDPEVIELNSTLNIDSSYVNGATFNQLDLEAKLRGNILTISRGELVSELLEGTFTGRKNLTDQADPKNDLAINLQINNLQPLASLADIRTLNATGNVSGHIRQSGANQLQFDGDIELYEIIYDTLFTAEKITSRSLISISEQYTYDLSLDIQEPIINGVGLQDLKFDTKGTAMSDSLNGIFSLNIDSEDAGNISQSGNYTYQFAKDRARIHWDSFQFQTPARILKLSRPFTLDYQESSIRTDTLMISSQGGTYFEMAIPYADSLSQNFWTRGKDFDFGVVQEILFNERYVDGVLSGELKLNREPSSLSGFGALTFSDLTYQNTNVDLMGIRFEIASERLLADLSVSADGTEKIEGHLDVPFIAADPSTLDDSFFERPVKGHLRVNPIPLKNYKEILKSFQINDTEGIFSFNGSLSGTASNPNMAGQFELQQPVLSGIPIDSAFASFEYDHQKKQILTQAEVNAQGQQAAFIKAEVPLSMDFRTFKLNTPGENDSLNVNIKTNDFNISVFNDFLDRRYLTNLMGTLNAELSISGTMKNRSPNGYLRLGNAQVNVPIAGIQISKIRSDFTINEEGLVLKNLSANSGNGGFNANGLITMDGLTPTNMDLTVLANRFRLANTSDYNLTIDLDSRLTGEPEHPKASGTLRVKNGFVYMKDFGEKSVESVVLEEENESSFSLYDSLALDMRFVIERNFLIRNRRYLDMEVELTGELEAQKQARSPLSLFGTLTAQRGYARPLGKQFTLDDGQFTFSGPIEDPELFIKTSYIPQSSQKQGSPIILYYIIDGSAQEPQFRFESEPTMEQQDIICYTLFNKPCYALESWQQVISGSSGSSPTNLLVDVLLDEIETLATRQLGIDVVQIENTRSGSNSGTSIKTGWYLNRRTFFAIVNEISGTAPKTLFILEYLISKNLDLILTQGDDNRQGIDLRWQHEY